MKLQTRLYIDTSGSPIGDNPNYERLDLFDFEDIQLTSSIQNIKKIEKVFTDYSQQFSIPASDKNNRLLKHYYNTNLADGFDARIKQRSFMSLNGVKFRDGYIRLSKVVLKDGKPYMYKIVFFGAMTVLKDVLGDLKLSALTSLERFNHNYNVNTVYSGFKTGLGLSGTSMIESANADIIYPSISSLDKWFYDSSASGTPSSIQFAQGSSTNLYDSTGVGTYGIDYLHLKPAIKVIRIIEAIEDRFESINFSRDFFGRAFFNELYLLMHNTKGLLTSSNSLSEPISLTYRVGTNNGNSDFQYVSGEPDQRPMITRWENFGALEKDIQQYDVIATVTPTVGETSKVFNIKILEDEEVIAQSLGVSGTSSLTATLCTENETTHPNISIVVETGGASTLSSFDVSLELKKVRYRIVFLSTPDPCNASVPEDTFSSFYSLSGTVTTLTTIDVVQHLPDITILDFLKGLFNQFNLTSEVVDGVINVKTLDNYYDSGKTIDITRYVHTDEFSLSRMRLYDNIKFMYAEPKTFGLKNQNEILQDDYGNLQFQLDEDGTQGNFIFDGEKYEIKLPFEKLFYERLSDEDDLTILTPFSNGWLADDNQSPVLTRPVLFFNVNEDIDIGDYSFGFKGISGPIATYNRPSNTSSGESYSLHFGSEFDEYSNNQVTRSLFSLFYKNYITNIFNRGSRILDIKAHFPLGFLLDYELSDTLSINGKEYTINYIRTNLSTGESNLQLLTKYVKVDETAASDIQAPTVPTGLTQGITTNNEISFSWNASTDNVAVTGYKVYVDSVLTQTLAVTTTTTLTGLLANTSYNVEVSAFDEAGNESAKSSVSIFTTSNDADIEAPSVPRFVTVDAVSSTSISISWAASTDNVAVTGYKVYIDSNPAVDVGNTTNYTAAGLTSNTTYEFSVTAYDAAGNESTPSLIVEGKTNIAVIS